MSSRLRAVYPKSLSEYLKLVEQLQRTAKRSLWFRGVGKTKYKLVPSLYRHPTKKTGDQLNELERQLMARFRQRSIPYISRTLSDDWDHLFFMQHYGVPTRLLDWTENSLVGLHFALMSAISRSTKNGRTSYADAAVVWVLDPVAWNCSAFEHVSYSGEPFASGDEQLKGYLRSAGAPMSAHPVALHGAHNSARIVAQGGVFTIFGKNKTPMESLVQKGIFPSRALSRIIIRPKCIQTMRDSLLKQGITESVVFPDLEGLARETKRHFGFEA